MTPLETRYDFILLTHPRECQKGTNSGFLLSKMLNARVIKWHRKQSTIEILGLNPAHHPVLIYPKDTETEPDYKTSKNTDLNPEGNNKTTLILLDGTWQECKKMLNQSPWLKDLPRLQLDCPAPSNFDLRRNSRPGTLSTCETAALLVKADELQNSNRLTQAFSAFVEAYSKGKNNQLISD